MNELQKNKQLGALNIFNHLVYLLKMDSGPYLSLLYEAGALI